MSTILNGVEGVRSQVGQDLGFGEWQTVTQARVNTFAEASGDYQWIHVDEERAAKGPFKKTIAHGLLTLSMINSLSKGLFKFEGFRMIANYGYDKIRFPTTVPVGSRVRAGAKIVAADDMPNNGLQIKLELTVEVEGSEKPACVAAMIMRASV